MLIRWANVTPDEQRGLQSTCHDLPRLPALMTASRPPRNRARRPYHQHGQGVVSRALPHLMERVLDPALPETALSLIERAARDWRQQVLDDLGGLDAVSATKRALLDAATGSMILLASLDAYVFALAGQGGLANRKHRRVFPVVLDRMRVADGLGGNFRPSASTASSVRPSTSAPTCPSAGPRPLRRALGAGKDERIAALTMTPTTRTTRGHEATQASWTACRPSRRPQPRPRPTGAPPRPP